MAWCVDSKIFPGSLNFRKKYLIFRNFINCIKPLMLLFQLEERRLTTDDVIKLIEQQLASITKTNNKKG